MQARHFVEHSEHRDLIVQRLRADVLGPEIYDDSATSKEILNLRDPVSPQYHYVIGHLHPQQWGGEESEAISTPNRIRQIEEAVDEQEEENEDSGISLTDFDGEDEEVKSRSTLRNPSSIGITTCFGKKAETQFIVDVNFSRYESKKFDKESKTRTWQRTPYTIQEIFSRERIHNGTQKIKFEVCPWVELSISRRKSRLDDKIRMTATITNTFEFDESSDQPKYRLSSASEWIEWEHPGRRGWRVFKDEHVIHQPIIFVESDDFEDVRYFGNFEDELGALLYHEVEILAKGHNVGVDWDKYNKKAQTDWVPSTEIPKLASTQLSGLPDIDVLSSLSNRSKSVTALKMVMTDYCDWIDSCKNPTNSYWDKVQKRGLEERLNLNIRSAELTASRINDGIELLESNNEAWKAFVLMNRAINLSQKCPAVMAKKGDRVFNWRPFQLFFILLNLTGITRNGSTPVSALDREKLDLLWFPTGGGKTEAYLGLIAYSSFLRRIQGETTNATVAIMRYTLRLLTMQQGERATRLILGMNQILASENISGPLFSVGMWIGNKTSPGTIKEAQKTLRKIAVGKPLRGAANPAQLPECPWCGSDFDEKEPEQNFRINSAPPGKAFDLVCTNSQCDFYEDPLPYSCIDEELYSDPPTLLISTVDKFARMCSKPEASVFLGKSTSNSAYQRQPPDLIILDELHLLSGPLGSIAGLWEAALQSLMGSWRPKYIAATATIKGAEKEVRTMFGRELQIFPPPMASIKDNFFSKEVIVGDSDSSRGRLHLGLLAPPSSARYGYYGSVASVLQSASVISESSTPEFVDPWWTIISYFNSKKEMAAAHNMLGDQVGTTLDLYASMRKENPRDYKLNLDELHGGRKPSELKQAMAHLEIPFGGSEEPLDVLQTTNMFQVGIDIDRLGVMFLTGQPFSNAEYVQASGRVGRQVPGLVLTTLRGSKPRDLSFYENFQTFHHRLYANVEAGSTTPYSPAVLDRLMRSIVMLLARVGIPNLAHNDSIRKLREVDNERKLKILISNFLETIEHRINDETLLKQIKTSIDRMYVDLRHFIKTSEKVAWRAVRNKPGWGHQVMKLSGGRGDIIDSMRDVDTPVPIGNEPRENQEAWKFTTLNSRQLFFRSGPGLLWEDEDGGTHITLALNRWAITDEQRFSLEYHSPLLEYLGDKLGRERYDNQKMRFHRPPRDAKTEGVITVDRLPYHRLCKQGHISTVRHDEACPQCNKPTSPVPLVSICDQGHIEAFNWNSWIGASHSESCTRKGANSLDHILVKRPRGSTSISSWSVTCTECKGSESLMGVNKSDRGWYCRGNTPWLKRTNYSITGVSQEDSEENKHRIRHMDRGNSGVGVGEQRLSLEIPPVQWHLANSSKPILMGCLKRPTLEKMQQRLRYEFEDPDDLISELAGSEYLVDDGSAINTDRLLEDATAHYLSINNRTPQEYLDKLRRDELKGFTEKISNNWTLSTGEFQREIVVNSERKSTIDGWYDDSFPISELVQIEKMRAIRILTGVTRNGGNEPAPIWDKESGAPWGLAEYENGEGIYFGLDLNWIHLLANRYLESGRVDAMNHIWANNMWPEVKEQIKLIEPLDIAKVVVLHTFSHLLMKEICTVAGYPMSSLSERLYVDKREGGRIARIGVLIYVTGAGNAGTMGGLSSLAAPELIYSIVRRALESVHHCSNDPICGSHIPQKNLASSNGASCHACTLLPEVSCEFGNVLLDRSSIAPEVADDEMQP